MSTDGRAGGPTTLPTVPLTPGSGELLPPSPDPKALAADDRARKKADPEERRSFRRAMLIGLFVWPAFILVDQYLGRFVYPGAPLMVFFGLRVLGQLAILSLYLLSFRRDVSSTTLQLANALVCGLASFLIAVMGVWFGGLTSPYLHGTSIVILILALAVPAPWRITTRYAVGCVLAYPAVVFAFSRLKPELHLDLSDPQRLALFSAHYVILISLTIVAAVSGQVSWMARQELRNARRLGRYRLEARIGEGGMNEVWLAFDPTLKRNVALKILRSSPDADPRVLRRFEREAHALSRLTSPCTVHIYDYGVSDDGFSFIAMEYLAGSDLQAMVKRNGPLGVERSLRLALLACRSLKEAHAAGIIHRDVKPANMFVSTSPDGEDLLKVLDFGIARLVSADGDATKTQSLRGTPAYMAPECWTGAEADARTDIYSMGATLYFMLTGHRPFSKTPPEELLRAHLQETPSPPSESMTAPIAKEVDAVVLRCLAKNPKSRFSTVAELESQIARALDAQLEQLEKEPLRNLRKGSDGLA